MKKLDRYRLIFDAFTTDEQSIDWSKVVPKLAQTFLRAKSRRAVFEACNGLVVSIDARGRMLGPIGDEMQRLLKETLPGFEVAGNQLLSSVTGMLAALYVLNHGRLRGSSMEKRETMAVALWLALTFQDACSEARREELRKDILETSQRVALGMASRLRQRLGETVQSASRPALRGGVDATALRWNSILDREEIDLLRWLLADETTLLGQPYEKVESLETLVVTRGLELGGLLRRFPTFEHYDFISQNCPPNRFLSLEELLEGLGDDRSRLARLYQESSIVQACPTVFPFLTALSGGCVEGRSPHVERPLTDWCGRALLESAAVTFSDAGWS